MTNDICNRVEEALALQLALDSESARHVQGCNSCSQLQAASQALYTSLSSEQGDLPLGFSARLTAHVQSRLRERRKLPGSIYIGLGIVGLVAVALFAFRAERETSTSALSQDSLGEGIPLKNGSEIRAASTPQRKEPAPLEEEPDFAAELALLADVEGSLRVTANWERYEEPIAEISAIEKELGR